MARMALAAGLMAGLAWTGAAQACEDWNTGEFFETATVDNVRNCLDGVAAIDARDEDDMTPLHWAAARSEDPAVIRALVTAGADVHAHAEYELSGLDDSIDGYVLPGWTPMHLAAAGNPSVAIIIALLVAEADVNAGDEGEFTPLHAAVTFNPEPVVTEALLAAGADVNAGDENESTPLHLATLHGDPAMVELLLKAGAEVNAGGLFGMTPLYPAIGRDPAMVELLLKAGADLEVQEAYAGRTPLHWAAQTGDAAAVGLLLEAGADSEARDDDGETPLHGAIVWNDNPAVLALLLDSGADPNARDEYDRTPLHSAAEEADNPAVLALLLDSGADPNARDEYDRTPLHLAAYGNDSPKILALLLDRGADPKARKEDGKTPLHVAAIGNDNPEVLALLLDSGADPNARDEYDRTPLHSAAERADNPAVLALLLDRGADPKARTEDGKTAWDLVQDNKDIKGSKAYLSSMGWAWAQSEVVPMAQLTIGLANDMTNSKDQSRFDRVIEWLDRGGDRNAVLDGDGNTFMHYAAYTELVFLANGIKGGGDCSRRNNFGATPLHFAASQWELGPGVEALRMLLDCGADPNAQDRDGNAPLHTMLLGLKHGHTLLSGPRFDVQEVLLEELGADPNIKNNDGDTLLMLFVRHHGLIGKVQRIAHLLRHGADPNTRNNKGETPLTELVALFSATSPTDDPAELVRLFVDAGADPDLRAGNSDTPLIRAAKHPDDSLYEVRALLAGGADSCLRDRARKIAYQRAEDAGAEAIMEELEKAGGHLDFVNSLNGVCVRDRRKAEEREAELGLDREGRARMQSCLKHLGFDPGPADGIFGPNTRAAIRSWQGSKDLNASGYFESGQTAQILRPCEAIAPSPATAQETVGVGPVCPRGRASYQASTDFKETGSECWQEIANLPGCHIWRDFLPEGEVTWSGSCVVPISQKTPWRIMP